jgi:hypothetical protein
MNEVDKITDKNLEPEKTIPIYDVKVGDRFYYADPHDHWVDICEIRKIEIRNGRQNFYVRTFITNKQGKVICKRTPTNPWYLYPEQSTTGYGKLLFRTAEEAYNYNVEIYKNSIKNDLDTFRTMAKRYNIQLPEGSYLKQLEAPQNK